MKRLLIITYYWPPTGGSGVQRWVKFSKYLPQFDWQPVIYTPLNPERLATDESLLGDIPSCAELIKTPIHEPYELYRLLTGSSASKEVNPISKSSKKSLKSRVSMWLRGNLFIPDPRVSWVAPSVRYLKKYLREHPVDAVVTTGPPHSMHLIGLGLKKAMGVKWIADFRDPWTEMFYYKHLSLTKASDRKHHRLEQQVLDSCDRVIAVSPPVRDDFAARTSTPVSLITNGYDEEDIPAEGTVEYSEKFRIVHTGLFAADGNPVELWQALGQRCKTDPDFRSRLQIRLCGKTDPQIKQSLDLAGLEGLYEDLGYLPHDKVVREQRAASVLLLPLRREAEYAKVLPGKIFEYMASLRPVLGIGQCDGAAAKLLDSSGCGKFFEWEDADGMMDFLLSPPKVKADVEQYSRFRLTESLAGLLDEVLTINK